MKHNSFKKVMAVFMAVLMMVTGCAVYASADDCDHDFSDKSWNVYPTCTEGGFTTYDCPHLQR